MALQIVSSFDISVTFPELADLPEIQLWEDSSKSKAYENFNQLLSTNPSLTLLHIVQTFSLPLQILTKSSHESYQVFTNNLESQNFLKLLMSNNEFKNGIGTLSLLVNVESSDKIMLLFYFEKLDFDVFTFRAVPVFLNEPLYETICDPSLLQTKYSNISQKVLNTISLKALWNYQEAKKDPMKNILEQVIQKRNRSLSRTNSLTDLPTLNKIKITLERAVMSGLRLRGITKTSTEYKELFSHTLRSVEFIFRKDIKNRIVPSIDHLQDSIDTLVGLYLNEEITINDKIKMTSKKY